MDTPLNSLMQYVDAGTFKPPANDNDSEDLLRAANALEDLLSELPDALPDLVRRKDRFVERVHRATAKFVELN